MTDLSTAQRAFLDDMRNVVVATIGRDGAPQISPTWYRWNGEAIVVSTDETTAKVRNVRRDPRVTVCIDHPETGRYAAASGRAELVEGEAVREPTLELIRKYRPEPEVVPHWERIQAINPRVLLIIRPQRWHWRNL